MRRACALARMPSSRRTSWEADAVRWREGGYRGCGGKGAYVCMAVQLAGNVAQIAPLARVVVARDEGRDVDLRHEGPIDEEFAVMEGVERLLDPHRSRCGSCRTLATSVPEHRSNSKFACTRDSTRTVEIMPKMRYIARPSGPAQPRDGGDRGHEQSQWRFRRSADAISVLFGETPQNFGRSRHDGSQRWKWGPTSDALLILGRPNEGIRRKIKK